MADKKTPRSVITDFLDVSKTHTVVTRKRHASILRTPVESHPGSPATNRKPLHGRIASLKKNTRSSKKTKQIVSVQEETPRQLVEGFLADAATSVPVQRVKRRRSEPQTNTQRSTRSTTKSRGSVSLNQNTTLEIETPRTALGFFLQNAVATVETPVFNTADRNSSPPSIPSSKFSYHTPSPLKSRDGSPRSVRTQRSSTKRPLQPGSFYLRPPLPDTDDTVETIHLPDDTAGFQTPSPFKSTSESDIFGSQDDHRKPTGRLYAHARQGFTLRSMVVPETLVESQAPEEEEEEERPFTNRSGDVDNPPANSMQFSPHVHSTQRPRGNVSSAYLDADDFAPPLSSTQKPQENYTSDRARSLGETRSSHRDVMAESSRELIHSRGTRSLGSPSRRQVETEMSGPISPLQHSLDYHYEERVPPTPHADSPHSVRRSQTPASNVVWTPTRRTPRSASRSRVHVSPAGSVDAQDDVRSSRRSRLSMPESRAALATDEDVPEFSTRDQTATSRRRSALSASASSPGESFHHRSRLSMPGSRAMLATDEEMPEFSPRDGTAASRVLTPQQALHTGRRSGMPASASPASESVHRSARSRLTITRNDSPVQLSDRRGSIETETFPTADDLTYSMVPISASSSRRSTASVLSSPRQSPERGFHDFPELRASPEIPSQDTSVEGRSQEPETDEMVAPIGTPQEDVDTPLQTVTPSPVVSPMDLLPSHYVSAGGSPSASQDANEGVGGPGLHNRTAESRVERSALVEQPANVQTKEKQVPKKTRKPRSKAGNSYSLPVSVVKKQFNHFAGMRVSKEAIEEVMKVSERYWDQLAADLSAYAAHAGRKTITNEDLILLFKRQGLVTPTQSMNSLIEKYLPMEYREKLIPVARSGNRIVPKV